MSHRTVGLRHAARRCRAGLAAVGNQRGMALPLAMLVLLILTTVAIAYTTIAGVEPEIAQNLASGVRARFLTEAGIEFGYSVMVASHDWSTTLGTSGGSIAAAQPLPSKTAAEGTFTVTVRNDNRAGDAAITGVPQDPGNDVTDTNTRLVMTSVGQVGGATRTITVVIGRVLTGKRQNAAQAGQGNNTVAQSPDLTPDKVAAFIQAAKDSADVVLQSSQTAPLSFNNIGNTCGSDVHSQACWGTRDNPKIIYVKGDRDPTSMFTALQLSGNTTGTGILIVEDGDLRINGNFRWEGPIIVTGQWVGVGYLGGGNQAVYGAVISNETATDPGFNEGVLTGNAKIRYSSEALQLVQNMPKLVRIFAWREL